MPSLLYLVQVNTRFLAQGVARAGILCFYVLFSHSSRTALPDPGCASGSLTGVTIPVVELEREERQLASFGCQHGRGRVHPSRARRLEVELYGCHGKGLLPAPRLQSFRRDCHVAHYNLGGRRGACGSTAGRGICCYSTAGVVGVLAPPFLWAFERSTWAGGGWVGEVERDAVCCVVCQHKGARSRLGRKGCHTVSVERKVLQGEKSARLTRLSDGRVAVPFHVKKLRMFQHEMTPCCF